MAELLRHIEQGNTGRQEQAGIRMAEIVHAKAGQIRPVQDAMKDTSQMAFLIQPALIIRTEPRSVTPSACHGFEFLPGAIGLQCRDQLGAEVHRSDFGGLGRFHLSPHGRSPFDADGVLTDIHVPRIAAQSLRRVAYLFSP